MRAPRPRTPVTSRVRLRSKHRPRLAWLARLIVCGLLLSPFPLPAGPPDPSPRLHVPLITGALDEKAWTRAARIRLADFWTQRGNPFEPSEVLLLNSGAALHVKFLVEDTDIRSDPARAYDGETFWDDCVELFFARPEDGVGEGVGLEINATGTAADLRASNPRKADRTWNFSPAPAQTPTATPGVSYQIERVPTLLPLGREATRAGWIIEVILPWQQLQRALALPGSAYERPTQIRANFARWNHGANGKIFTLWADPGFTTPDPHAPWRYGWLILDPRPAQP